MLLDVVYNHFGPDGNYLRVYADDYFTDRHTHALGRGGQLRRPRSQHVRHFVLQNVRYWLHEYHLDGLRLDATHAIVDDSAAPPAGRDRRGASTAAAGPAAPSSSPRTTATWSSRSARRAAAATDWTASGPTTSTTPCATYLTGEREGYYANYTGTLDDVATTIEQGFLFQGQKRPASASGAAPKVTDEPARAFVFCSENHDQVGNRALGERLAPPDRP